MDKHFCNPIGECTIQSGCLVGVKYRKDCKPVLFGDQATIRAGTIIYADVKTGKDFQTGHNAVIREKTIFGDHIVVGSGTVIDGNCTFGDFIKIESNCYIPTHVTFGSRIFVGPGVTITNDKYPLKMRDDYVPMGPVIEDGVTLGGGVTIVPGVIIGKGSFVAAGAVVTKDVPPFSLVISAKENIMPLPEKLQEFNIALNWRKYLE